MEEQKKKKGPLFWIGVTSGFWLVVISLLVIISFVLLASNKNVQKMVLDRIQSQIGLESDSDFLKTEKEKDLEDELDTTKEKLQETEIKLKVEKELRNELLENCSLNTGNNV